MQLSRSVEYGLHALLQLANSATNGPISSSRLATAGVMPDRFLLQVLRLLVTHDLLRSTRGADGGYVLARDPRDISLLNIIEAVEGPLTMKSPSSETLPVPTWTSLRQTLDLGVAALRAEYSKWTLAEILSNTTEPATIVSDKSHAPSGDASGVVHNSPPKLLLLYVEPNQRAVDGATA